MYEKQSQPVEIKINVTGRVAGMLIVALLVLGMIVCARWGGERVSAAGDQSVAVGSSGLRQYYLSDTYADGVEADTEVCTTGYHMASLWEILDTSNLEYNTTLGFEKADSGLGPPTNVSGWVRTGNDSSNSTSAGDGNCLNWDSDTSTDAGTIIRLEMNWSSGVESWKASTMWCHVSMRVWCIED